MKTRLFVISIISGLVFVIMLYFVQSHQNSVQTIKYFPLNETSYFTNAATQLSTDNGEVIDWAAASTAEASMYLRQDVSLLYENGFFKGVQNKWQQKQKEISFAQAVPLHETSIFEAISFHQGEIHQSPGDITSIQKMTFDKAYFNRKGQTYEQLESGHQLTAKIDQKKNERLIRKWHQWITHHDIDEENYVKIPLTNLANFEEEPLPGLSDTHSKQVIGKLWEGLYKNYILRLKEKQNQTTAHLMPLILLSKDGSHLYVVFELNDQEELLFQKIESSKVTSSSSIPH